MDLIQQSTAKHSDRTISRLVAAAAGVILFTIAAGFVLHRNIDRLIAARDWVDRSQQIDTNLQVTLLRLDRLDTLVSLYLLDQTPGRLKNVQNLAIAIESSTRTLVDLVADNPTQIEKVKRLDDCSHDLVLATRSLAEHSTSFPAATQSNCREIAVLIQERERTLLRTRGTESEKSQLSLMVVGVLLAAFSILVVIILFGVLLRDALFRSNSEQMLAITNEQLAATVLVLEESAQQMKLLGDARDQLQMCVATQEAYDITVHFVSQLLPASGGALCMIDNSRQMIETRSTWGANDDTLDAFPLEACCGMRSGHLRWRTPSASVLHCSHFRGEPPSRYICLPLVAHSDTLGVLYIQAVSDQAAANTDRQLPPLRALLQLASMTIAGLNLQTRLENQSIRDSLTGLFNRHFMEITLDRELRRASRHENSLAVFMIDTDNFKRFNDTFGHKAGDLVLRAIAEKFLSSVRSEDFVCRYGGEEFVIILPDITPAKAAERAEHVREAIHSLRVVDNGQTLGVVTVSIGVAAFPLDGRSIEELLQASDRSLYAAKNGGRNQVVFAAQAANTPIPAR